MPSKSAYLSILNTALSTGGDYAEIYIEEKVSQVVSIENGKVDASSVSRTYGAGLRILQNVNSVYGYTNDVSTKGLLELAKSLSNSFNGKQVLQVETLKTKHFKNNHPAQEPLSEVSVEDKINYIRPAEKVMREYDKRIVRTKAAFANSQSKITIINSNGLIVHDEKQRGRAILSAIASDGEKYETAFEGPGAMSGFEHFKNDVDIVALAKEAAKSAITMLSAKDCPSGKMTVVIGNGNGGVIFHEACGHSLEATSVSKNLSVFSNKLGTQIASKVVSAIDDGTIANSWGSNNIDDEGNKTQKVVLIENGILKNYLVDTVGGRRMGMKPSGCSRRESYKYEPTSRMSNTYICNGKSTPEEIIAATKLGLYAKTLSGGSVNPATGEFNFGCSEAYIIRDGKICEPVRGASLIGTGGEVLMNIDMVGNDCDRSNGMCGSVSGYIPVDIGQPTIRVQNILVGGNGGELK
ncbi:MAG: TldD/PmbA family protein [Bacilli bacterium]|nr:TldD/PmbA family protein [Bacilli bacterium]